MEQPHNAVALHCEPQAPIGMRHHVAKADAGTQRGVAQLDNVELLAVE